MNQTTFAKKGQTLQNWFQIDASNLPVGRLAAQVATILQGKNKPEYTPNIDTGDYIIIVNADKVMMTGNKENSQMYRYHTLYPGGLKEKSFKRLRKEHPDRIVKYAVSRMMPKTTLGHDMLKKLYIYAGTEHSHQAQCPQNLELNIERRV
jgi:large subunit ribosomal protein L13